jgi:hypothetical protein
MPHAVAAVVAGVDVAREDLVLGLLAVHLQGDDQFLQLARDGLVLRQVEVLDVLLGDRRTTLLALAGEGVDQTAGRALEVDAGVVVEGLVLGGDEGHPDALGDLVQVDELAVDVAVAGERIAVAVLVDVALLDRGGVALGHVDHQVQSDEGDHPEQAEAEERPEELLPGEEAAYAALGAVLGALGSLAASWSRSVASGPWPCRTARDTARGAGSGRALRRGTVATALPRTSLFRSSHGSVRSASVSRVSQVRSSGQLSKLTPRVLAKDGRSRLLRT